MRVLIRIIWQKTNYLGKMWIGFCILGLCFSCSSGSDLSQPWLNPEEMAQAGFHHNPADSLIIKDQSARTSSANPSLANPLPAESSSPPECDRFDVNGDGIVNGIDSAEIGNSRNFGHSADEAANPRTDVNGDGVINGLDLGDFSNSGFFGQECFADPIPLDAKITDTIQNGNLIYAVGHKFADALYRGVLVVMDITDPAHPRVVYREETPGAKFGGVDLDAQSSLLAVTGFAPGGFIPLGGATYFYSLAESSAPTLVSTFTHGNFGPHSGFFGYSGTPYGSHYFISAFNESQTSYGQSTLLAVSLNTPSDPQILSQTPVVDENGQGDAAVNCFRSRADEFAYCGGTLSLKKIDYRNPLNPIITTSINADLDGANIPYDIVYVGGSFHDNQFIEQGDFIYQSRNRQGDDRVYTWDISGDHPVLVASLEAGSGEGGDLSALALSTDGTHLISYQGAEQIPIMALNNGIPELIALENPQNPEFCNAVSYFSPFCHVSLPEPEGDPIVHYTFHFHINGNYLYEGVHRWQIWDVTDFENPVWLGSTE